MICRYSEDQFVVFTSKKRQVLRLPPCKSGNPDYLWPDGERFSFNLHTNHASLTDMGYIGSQPIAHINTRSDTMLSKPLACCHPWCGCAQRSQDSGQLLWSYLCGELL